MGSMITLGIGKMEIDWGKNNIYRNHSKLFQKSDRRSIPYYYSNEYSDELIIEMKDGFSRKMHFVKSRLDLLGYSMEKLENTYNQFLKELDFHSIDVKIPFHVFKEVIYNIDVKKVNVLEFELEGYQYGYDFGEYARDCLMKDAEINRLFENYSEEHKFHLKYDLETYMENIDPYVLIRIIAENPMNNNLDLQWRYKDIVEGGWESEDNIFKGLDSKDKILIVTEGSSDSFILRKTLENLYVDVADFFEFVDMNENYPFTGVGNLYNFFLGLVRINVQNNIIIVFDNDIAGNEKYCLAKDKVTPDNIMIYKLPELQEFDSFQTIGPSGKSIEDINLKAVSIECFLDLSNEKYAPLIRWMSYSKKVDQYQGVLVNKDKYVRRFKSIDLLNSSYNSCKLKFLIDDIIQKWITN